MLLLAVADLRWPVSNIISTTDATPTSGATTVAVVNESLARALYQSTEVVGARTRLAKSRLPRLLDPIIAPDDLLAVDMVQCVPRSVSWSVKYAVTEHVNLREAGDIYARVRGSCQLSLIPARLVNGIDSLVSVAALAKGRSRSLI